MEDSTWLRPFSVLLAPRKTFTSIAERPSWLPPLLLILLIGTVAGLALVPKIDYSETIREAVERQGQTIDAESEEQIQQGVEIMERFGWVFALLGSLVFQPLGILVSVLIFWLVFKTLGSELSFVDSLAVVAHALMPLVIASVITLAIGFGRESLTAEQLQTGLVASNPAAFLSDDASPTLTALLRQFDFFSFWILFLITTGFTAVSRLKPATVAGTTITIWLLWMLCKFAFAMVGNMFGG